MAEAIVLHQSGGPEVLRAESVEVGVSGPGELRVRQTAVGVNFHDVYVRSGLYRTLPLPGIPGIEAAGIVEEVGDGVSGFAVGDRIAYVTSRYGAYASERLLPADLAVRLPSGIAEDLAATVLLKGLTAEMLLRQVHRVQPGDHILVQAAAGGVGRLLCQWAAHLGATVIGTAGSEEKAELARDAGCRYVILYRRENFVERVREITDGRGVDVVYDSVGKDTFHGSLESLATFGHLVNFGQSSGSVEPFEVSRLSKGSNSLSRPVVFHYVAHRGRLEAMAAVLFDALAQGVLTAEPGKAFPLSQAAAAHEELESRRAPGPLLLVP
jgi:NADPH2:quinone reductase